LLVINLQLALSFSPLKKPFIFYFYFFYILDMVLVLKIWNPDSTLVPVLGGKDLEPGSGSKPSLQKLDLVWVQFFTKWN
jgi:hypothetical protein